MIERRIKTAQINLKVHPAFKAAAEKAAADDQRTLTSLFEKLVYDHLKRQERESRQ